MPLKKPSSVEECVYFTNRTIVVSGRAMAWVFKKQCPKCKKGVMGKPQRKAAKLTKKPIIMFAIYATIKKATSNLKIA
jgi:hypothetical protein